LDLRNRNLGVEGLNRCANRGCKLNWIGFGLDQKSRIDAAGLIAPVAKIGRRNLQLRQSRMSLPDPHEFAGIAKRERLDQNGIDDGE
jgi:hypothetical protein